MFLLVFEHLTFCIVELLLLNGLALKVCSLLRGEGCDILRTGSELVFDCLGGVFALS